MYEGVYFQLRLQLPPGHSFADWTRQVLLHQRERLAPVPGFADLDTGDDDLLGGTAPGILPPTATVSDLVIHLRSDPDPGRLLVEIGAWGEDGLAFVHGFLLDWDTYREYRLPLIYAAAAAAALAGTGHVSLLGEAAEADDDEDYEDVAIFTDVAEGQLTISEPDPGELTVTDLVARFGEVGADEAYERMLSG
ncbi:MAG TPA: hypothetical protein VF834_00610 [Streptosporangiaceae bacterium]